MYAILNLYICHDCFKSLYWPFWNFSWARSRTIL